MSVAVTVTAEPSATGFGAADSDTDGRSSAMVTFAGSGPTSTRPPAAWEGLSSVITRISSSSAAPSTTAVTAGGTGALREPAGIVTVGFSSR